MPRNGDNTHYTGVFRLAHVSPSRPAPASASSSSSSCSSAGINTATSASGSGAVNASEPPPRPPSSSTTTTTAVTAVTAVTAADPPRKVIKRNRQVISCMPCRTRKLKCDRQQPCASCVKRQDEDSCRFLGGHGPRGKGAVRWIVNGGGSGGEGLDRGDGASARDAAMVLHDRMDVDSGAGATNAVAKRAAQARLQLLERLVGEWMVQGAEQSAGQSAGAGQTNTARTTTPTAASQPRKDTDMRREDDSQGLLQQSDGGHLRRQGNQVRFVGATTYEAVLECIRDLQGFVEAAEPAGGAKPWSPTAPAPFLSTRQRDGSTRDSSSSSSNSNSGHTTLTINQVLAQLPSKTECDGFLTFYFQQVYMVPPMLHAGHFQRAYERFWRNPHATSLLWISILFSLLSTSMFQQKSRAAALGQQTAPPPWPSPADRIAAFSTMAYRCLEAGEYLAGKPHSVEATLLYGMHLVLQKRDVDPVCWHMLSTAVRLAQRMGYHRDASHLARDVEPALSAFEAEMRRRTWYTLEYFDVVYSFQLGVPPVIQPSDVDTCLPANLRDDEFDELDSEHHNGDQRLQQKLDRARHPASSSSSLLEFTPILGFIYYARQIQLLRRVVQQALAVNPPPTYGDVRRLDADLRALHADIPPSLRYRPVRESGFADSPDVIMRRLVCEVMYLKSLCVLHRRYLLRGWTGTPANADFGASSVGGVYAASRRTCCEAALGLLDLQAEFDEHSSEPGARLYERRYILTNTGYHDFLLAVMCLCLDLTAATGDGHTDKVRKLAALQRARAVWAKMGTSQKDAVHATRVLDNILARIAQPPGGDARRADANSDSTAVTTSRSNRDKNKTNSNSNDGDGRSNATRTGPHSQFWAFGWMDDMEKRTASGQAYADHARGSLDGVLGGGGGGGGEEKGVDWNLIDSFLLHRDHTTGGGSGPAGPSAREAAKDQREGWPMMRYDSPPLPPCSSLAAPAPAAGDGGGGGGGDHSRYRPAGSSGTRAADGGRGRDGGGGSGGHDDNHRNSEDPGEGEGARGSINYRTWSTAGITLTGFGPSSSGATFM